MMRPSGNCPEITHVFFDFFGVLHPDPQGTLLAERGFDRDGDGFSAVDAAFDLGQLTYQEYVKEYARLAGEDPQKLVDYFASFCAEPRMKQLVADLLPDYGVGLVSNASPKELRPILKRNGLGFHDVVISGEVGVRKPDDKIYLLALGRLSAEPGSSVFIDDTPQNVETAERLGMTGLRFTDYELLVADLGRLGVPAPVVEASSLA